MAENYELNVNVDGVKECIDALDSAKHILDGCQSDVNNMVYSINCLPHGNAGNLVLSVEPFDALDISNLQYQLQSVLDQIEDYNRANSSGEGNWFSNLFGGLAQGVVGVGEGLVDGFASIILDLGDVINVSGEWENGLADFIKEDWSYKAGYTVGNGLSGGKGYDENSGSAVAGKFAGTMVAYGAISCIPVAGGVAADAIIGGVSGFGQGTQKALRKQGIQTESEWSKTLNNKTVGRSDVVSKKAVSNSIGTAASEAAKGAVYAVAANGLFKVGGKVISKVRGKGVSATSGLDDAAEVGLTGKVTKSNDKIAEMLNKNADEIIDGAGKSANGVKSAASKVDDAANAADDAASAVSKADDTFRESGQKLVDAQTNLDEGYKSGKSEFELGNLEEKRDIAKKAFSDAGGDSQELMNAVSEKVNASRKLQELGDRADAPSDSYYFNQLDEGINKITTANNKIDQLLEKTDDAAGNSSGGVKNLFRRVNNKDSLSKVDNGAKAASKVDNGAKAASKADDTFRESGQKLVDAQTNLDEGYKSGKSEFELGNLEEKRDIAKKAFSDAGGDSQELMNAASEKVNASRKLQELGDRADAPSDSYYFQQLDERISKIADADSKISQLLGKTDGAAKSASKSADDVAGAAGDSVSKSLFRKLINKDSVILTIADKATSRKVDFPTTSNDSKSNTSTSSPETTSPTTSSPETTSPTTSSPETTSPTTSSPKTTSPTTTQPAPTSTTYQPAPTSTASQPAPAPTASQPAPTSAASQPTPTSTTSQTTAPPSTTSTTAPPSTTSTTASSTTSTPITTSSVTAAPSIVSKNSSTIHTGGRYSGTGGYTGTGDYTGTNSETGITNGVTDDISDKTSVLDDNITSIEDVIKGSNYTKIPTSSKPVITTSSSRTSAAIPISAAASAAAAAGIGAKAYLDRKNNNDNGSSDEINTDEWTGDDAVDIQYDDSSDTNAGENVLDADDDYSYQPAEDTEKYDARSSDELADLQ